MRGALLSVLLGPNNEKVDGISSFWGLCGSDYELLLGKLFIG